MHKPPMIQQQQNDLIYFQFESFLAAPFFQHAVFSRHGGVSPAPFNSLHLSVSVPDSKANVYANRRRAFGIFGRDTETAVHAHLVHGSAVARGTQADNGTWAEHKDAIITNELGCALTMNFADCAPILLVDPVQKAIGLGHAGWKGSVVDLPGAMVRAMQQEFGSQPSDLLAGIGPCISWETYEVDEPLVSEVRAAFADHADLLRQPNGAPKLHYDLAEANRRILLRAGVTQIELSGVCTGQRTDLFFSHRVEKGKTGRFGVMMVMNAT